jgi:hypothetical protein
MEPEVWENLGKYVKLKACLLSISKFTNMVTEEHQTLLISEGEIRKGNSSRPGNSTFLGNEK